MELESYVIHRRTFNSWSLKKGLEDDPFLLGRTVFRGQVLNFRSVCVLLSFALHRILVTGKILGTLYHCFLLLLGFFGKL